MTETIPDAVRRFLLTSIPTVPHLETLLLLWREPAVHWSAGPVAARLYLGTTTAQGLLDDLVAADLVLADRDSGEYRARREPPSFVELIDELDRVYSRRIRDVTELIHSTLDRKAQDFADGFSWRKR